MDDNALNSSNTESVEQESLSSLLAQDDELETTSNEVEAQSLTDILKDDSDSEVKTDETPGETSIAPQDYDWSPDEEYKSAWEGRTEVETQEFEAFKTYAKDKGLSNEVFSDLMNMHIKTLKSVPERVKSYLASDWDKQMEDWNKQIINDPVYGKANYVSNAKAVKEVIKNFGDAETRQYFIETGMAANPQMFKFLSKIGNSLTEGKFVSGEKTKTPKSLAEIMYKHPF